MEEERSLSEEIMSLKRSQASYKSENTKLRREVERWKSLEHEACEVVEAKCAIIDRQREHIFSLTKENESLQEELRQYRDRPWYRRIFSK